MFVDQGVVVRSSLSKMDYSNWILVDLKDGGGENRGRQGILVCLISR